MYEIIQDDQQAFVFLNNLGSKPFDPFWLMLSETWIWVPLYVIFLYLLYKTYGKKNILYILIFIALGVTVSDQLAGIFKNGIMRFRPCNDPVVHHLMRIVKCGGPYGFYSSHASNTFFIATFMSFMEGKKFRILPYIVFFWALMVSYSRIYIGVHYPMDILMGAAVGFLLGGFFQSLAKTTIYRLEKSRLERQNQSL